jgi:hypothetical protein
MLFHSFRKVRPTFHSDAPVTFSLTETFGAFAFDAAILVYAYVSVTPSRGIIEFRR